MIDAYLKRNILNDFVLNICLVKYGLSNSTYTLHTTENN